MLVMGLFPNIWLSGIETAFTPAQAAAQIKLLEILQSPSSIPPEIKASPAGGQQ